MKVVVITGLMGCGKTTLSKFFDKEKTIILHTDDYYRKCGFHRERILDKIIEDVNKIKENYRYNIYNENNEEKMIIIEGFLNKNDIEKCHNELHWCVFVSDFTVEESLSIRRDLRLTSDEYIELLDKNKF